MRLGRRSCLVWSAGRGVRGLAIPGRVALAMVGSGRGAYVGQNTVSRGAVRSGSVGGVDTGARWPRVHRCACQVFVAERAHLLQLTDGAYAVSSWIQQGAHDVHTKPFLTPADVAAELDISSSTVLRKIHAGEIPAIAVSDRIYRIPSAGFELYKAGRLRQAQMAPLGGREARPRIGQGERLPEARDEAKPARRA
jgi:excisionase family DNA binding protein